MATTARRRRRRMSGSTAKRPGSRTAASPTITWCSREPARRRAPAVCRPSWSMPTRRASRVAERIEVIAPHPLATLKFEACRVPVANRLGEPGEGFKVAMATLDIFRSTVGAAALGFARRALHETVEHAATPQTVRRAARRSADDAGHHRRQRDRGRCRRAAGLSRRLGEGSRRARASPARPRWRRCSRPRAAQRVIDRAVQLHGGARRHQGRQGRGALPRNPRAAHLRGRDRSAEDRDRARGVESNGRRRPRWRRNRRRSMATDRVMSIRSRGTICRRATQWPEFKFDLPELQYPERLNCVTELVDRWVDARAGRPRRACSRPTETLTYAQLAERINRIANVLTRDLGMVPGNRVLLRAPNNPMVVAAYFAVIKAGGVVVATMPLLRAKELSYPLAKARIELALCDARLADEMEKAQGAVARAEARRLLGGDAPDALEALMAKARLREVHRLRHRERRRLPDRVHLRHHRRAEGHDAFPSRHAGDLRQLCQTRAAAPSRRSLHRLAAARLHVRARRPRAVPAPHRRVDGAAREGRAPTSCSTAIAKYKATICFTAPTAYRAMLRQAQGPRHLVAAQMRLRRRDAAEGDVRRLARTRPASRSSTASARPRCCTSSSARPSTRCAPARPARPVPGYEARVIDDDGHDGAAAAPSAASRCAGRPAAAISPTSARRNTCRTAGTSPATPT